jgi:hypothetical protein
MAMSGLTTQPNLYFFDTYPKRYYATEFCFEYERKYYKMASEFSYGMFAIGVFVKLIRQYFAKRTPESNTVFFEGVPVSSPEDLQNINITFDFTFKNEMIGFHYIIRNTDTGNVIVKDERDDVPLYTYYTRPISPEDCNQCDETDYVFEECDFDDDDEYDMMAIMKSGFM